MEESTKENGQGETTQAIQSMPPAQALELAQQTMFEVAAGRITQIETMQKFAVKITKAQDWINYGDKPGMSGPCAERIARLFGLKFYNMPPEPIKQNERNGSYSYTVSGEVGFSQNETLPIIGSCNSKKPFFAKAHGEEVPQTEIDPNDIKKNALTNFFVNAVSRFLGLRGLTWADLEQMSDSKIKQSGAKTVDFKSGGADQDDQAKFDLEVVWKKLLEMNGQSVADAKRQLKELTSFTGKDGKKFHGYTDHLKVSVKKLPYLKRDVERLYQEWGGPERAGDKASGTPPPEATPSDPSQATNGSNLVETAQRYLDEIEGLNPAYGKVWAAQKIGNAGFENLEQMATDTGSLTTFMNEIVKLRKELKNVQGGQQELPKGGK
jgi:hypothetical protein